MNALIVVVLSRWFIGWHTWSVTFTIIIGLIIAVVIIASVVVVALIAVTVPVTAVRVVAAAIVVVAALIIVIPAVFVITTPIIVVTLTPFLVAVTALRRVLYTGVIIILYVLLPIGMSTLTISSWLFVKVLFLTNSEK